MRDGNLVQPPAGHVKRQIHKKLWRTKAPDQLIRAIWLSPKPRRHDDCICSSPSALRISPVVSYVFWDEIEESGPP